MPSGGVSVLIFGGSLDLMMLASVAVMLIGAGLWVFLSSRQTPAQRERKRRQTLNRTGRMGEAYIIDVRDCILYYSYELRGVAYTTSQDASDFKEQLPAETSHLIGPAGMKYAPANPANSIVICEDWSGLPGPVRAQEISLKEKSHT